MVSRWRGRMSPKCRRSSVASLGSSSRSHDGHDRSIHETDVGVRVPIAQVSDPPVADGRRILHCVRSISDVAHQRDQRTRVEMTADQEVDLDQDRCWDDEGFLGRLDEGTARRMVGVRSIQRRLGRAGVRDQRHERGSGRSPADRRAVSVRPDAPMPMLRGHGRIAATLSWIASRMTVAMDTPRSAAIRRRRSRVSSGSIRVVRSMASRYQCRHNPACGWIRVHFRYPVPRAGACAKGTT